MEENCWNLPLGKPFNLPNHDSYQAHDTQFCPALSNLREEGLVSVNCQRFPFESWVVRSEYPENDSRYFEKFHFPYGPPQDDENIEQVASRLAGRTDIVLAGRRVFEALWSGYFPKRDKNSVLYRLLKERGLMRGDELVFAGSVFETSIGEPMDKLVLCLRSDPNSGIITWGTLPYTDNASCRHIVVLETNTVEISAISKFRASAGMDAIERESEEQKIRDALRVLVPESLSLWLKEEVDVIRILLKNGKSTLKYYDNEGWDDLYGYDDFQEFKSRFENDLKTAWDGVVSVDVETDGEYKFIVTFNAI